MTRKRKSEVENGGENWKREKFGAKDFEKQYGYVGGGGGGELESVLDESKNHDKSGNFPQEIVTYLKGIIEMIEGGEERNDMLMSRCMEECSGQEDRLLSYHNSCKVVETIFGPSHVAASDFLRSVSRLKERRILDLFFSGCSAHTIEQLLYAMNPVNTNQDIEILHKFCELVCDNLMDIIVDKNASFIPRALLRITCGLGREASKDERGFNRSIPQQDKSEFASKEMEEELRKTRDRLVIMTTDYNLLSDRLDNSTVSLVVQSALSGDEAVKGKAATRMAQGVIEKIDVNEDAFIASLKGKNSSRVWEKVISLCDEQSRLQLWQMCVGGSKVAELAKDNAAFFFIQTLIKNTKGEELATDIMDDLSPLISSFLDSHKVTIVGAMIKCVEKFDDLQPPLIKALRRYFDASKASNKKDFFFNVLTWKSVNSGEMDVEKSNVHGSVLLQSLLGLTHCSSLQENIRSFPPSIIKELSINRISSHVVQAILQSNAVSDDTKNYVIKAFEKDWQSLIESPIGSFVFDSVWNSNVFDVSRKQNLMKNLVSIFSTSKSWKCTLYKCDAGLFKKDIKGWVNKWKQSGQKSEKSVNRQVKIEKKKEKKQMKKEEVEE
ncbi:hypothetical protein PRIPAC_80950 [Pristionchus pacificus]|uniref:Uncharacterized protein n=1 Tax=Pristionchus pacificus TaxID=54126 RepID=A0A454XR71_PRIPA|nr:hypothetical protein PRIPAC_80950 [Pristionchus pacificus]|eukprot:PDM64192.1 hypothetical protein PRIPAC_54436 [Pristionchus pacificus]